MANWLNLSPRPKRLSPPTSSRPLCSLALTDDRPRVFRGLEPLRPSQILLHKKNSTQPAEHPTNGCIPSMIWNPPPYSMFMDYMVTAAVLGACIMYFVFGLHKLQVVTRLRCSGLTWRLIWCLHEAQPTKTGQATQPVTSEIIQTVVTDCITYRLQTFEPVWKKKHRRLLKSTALSLQHVMVIYWDPTLETWVCFVTFKIH